MKPYYEDDACTIYHGEACAVLAQLPVASVDVLLTDPPYSSGGMFRSDRQSTVASKYNVANAAMASDFSGDTRDQRSWCHWVAAWSWAALRLTTPGAHCFVFSDWRQAPAATDAVQLGGWAWRGLLVWDKVNTRPLAGRFYATAEFITWGTNGAFIENPDAGSPAGVIRVPPVRGNEREHVTQKPVALLEHLLRVVPGDEHRILDPFMGSGSTLVAAKYAGHKAIGIEIEERYCEIAAKRLAQEVLPL